MTAQQTPMVGGGRGEVCLLDHHGLGLAENRDDREWGEPSLDARELGSRPGSAGQRTPTVSN